MSRLFIMGCSGHGKVVADIAIKTKRFEKIFFLDDNTEIKECMQIPVVGKSDYSEFEPNDSIIVAIGNSKIRQRFQEMFEEKGITIETLIHPAAVVGTNVTIGKGTVVMAGAIINSDAVIGSGCIINTSSSVDHDCNIENYVHISVGSHVAGTVNIGERTWIGAGATVSNNVSICSDCMIGAGAVVVNDIKERGTYVGVPVKRI